MRDRDLVRLHWPFALRPAFDALFAIDDAMGDVVVRATQPALAAIKLAWWREALEGLDRGLLPAEPRLQAVVAELLPKGTTGADLARLEAGWAALLDERPNSDTTQQRGAILFEIAGRLLGDESAQALAPHGRLYAVGRLRRLGCEAAGEGPVTALPVVPRRFRPLTGLAALAKRDLTRREAEATPGRALALIRHRLTGRL